MPLLHHVVTPTVFLALFFPFAWIFKRSNLLNLQPPLANVIN
jgi:hypothetical protein